MAKGLPRIHEARNAKFIFKNTGVADTAIFDQQGNCRSSHQRLTVTWAGYTWESSILANTPEAMVSTYIISVTGTLTTERFMIDWLKEQGLGRCWFSNWPQVKTDDKLKANMNLARLIKVLQTVGEFCLWRIGLLASGKIKVNKVSREVFILVMTTQFKL